VTTVKNVDQSTPLKKIMFANPHPIRTPKVIIYVLSAPIRRGKQALVSVAAAVALRRGEEGP